MSQPTFEQLRYAIDVAMHRRPGSLLLKNARLINVFTLDVSLTSILIAGEYIAAIGDCCTRAAAEQTIDLEGAWVSPGLIDAHLHIESSLVTPPEYAKAVVPRGVTGIVADPHEVANVAGVPAIEWMMRASQNLPMDVWFTAPSSVPSTRMETSGATLEIEHIQQLLKHPKIVGVAELMSFPGFLAASLQEIQKVEAAEAANKRPDGHAPGVMGSDLQAYLAAGVSSDHESTTLKEALEKLASGCFVMIREGSATRNLEALISLVDARYGDRIGLVTDDRLPQDLLTEGGVDFLVRKAIALGADPAYAIRAASYNAANYFGLRRRGAVAPGYQADLIVLDALHEFHATSVYHRGKCVAQGNQLVDGLPASQLDPSVIRTTHIPKLSLEDLKIQATGNQVRVIQAIPNQILTQERKVIPKLSADGLVVADPERDLAKLLCVERHGRHGRFSLGLAGGFGLKAGALASTVAHDHHNCLVLGTNDSDMLLAARRLEELGGGMVAVDGGQVIAELGLPIAGLLSDQPLESIRLSIDHLNAAAESLGCVLPSPFMALSFMGLAVIPELRLTDRGLVDVNANQFVTLFVDA
jgi:adenine deaminase